MKKIFYIITACVCAALFYGSPKTELGKLQPVELVMVTQGVNQIRIETDTGDSGQGSDFLSALEDLKTHSPKTVFLNTADYLVISPMALGELEQIAGILRPGIQAVYLVGRIEPEEAAQFLSTHKSSVNLKQLFVTGKTAPILQVEPEGCRLME